jgi:hypothetical protein
MDLSPFERWTQGASSSCGLEAFVAVNALCFLHFGRILNQFILDWNSSWGRSASDLRAQLQTLSAAARKSHFSKSSTLEAMRTESKLF